MISFSGWQSVDINFFKMFWSCLFKRFLIKTGNEIKWRLRHWSQKFCITVRSDGSCLLWVMSTEISVDIAVDIAVDTRSTVVRHSVDTRSTVGRYSGR